MIPPKIFPLLLFISCTFLLFACPNPESTEDPPDTPASVPAGPDTLSATTVSAGQIDLQWRDNADNEQGFRVERAVGQGSFAQVTVLSADVESYSDTGLTAGTTYIYRVSAFNDTGSSGYSNEAGATTLDETDIEAPSQLTAVASAEDTIELSWTDNSDNEDGFRIEQSVSGGAFSELTAVGAGTESYSDTGLTPQTNYAYRIRAFNSEEESAYSNVADATTPALPVDQPPSDLSAIAVSWNTISLSWSDNSINEDGFKIERATAGLSFSQIAEVSAGITSYNDTGLSPSTEYHYRVRAFNSAGDSEYTDQATAVTDEMPDNAGQIIVDHTVVDRYDDIPQVYIDEVKKMYLNIPGESHSSGYRIGLTLLMALDSKFQVIRTDDGPPAAYTTEALRVDRLVRNQYNNWSEGAGEREWYTWHAWDPTDDDYPEAYAVKIKSHITYANTNDLEIAAMGFGWCWDFTWHNSPGGDVDPVYNVRWAGSSVGGPDGDLRWGLDDGDTSLTGNRVNMDDYLAATQEYIDHVNANGFNTVVFFTTGPVDGNSANEAGYQREIKHQYIRDYVLQDAGRVVFDYADILCWNDDNEQNTGSWDGHTYPQIHPDNRLDYDDEWNMISAVEDGDHIGEVGALRLGKALWWMLARIAGWDGN